MSLVTRAFNYLSGRHTTFALGFFVVGNTLQFMHRLDTTYITFMGTLLGLVLGHSVQENLTINKQTGDDNSGK